MESIAYETILDAVSGVGIYVIQEADHSILYYNKWVEKMSPEVRLGIACHDVWSGSCENCPLLTIKGQQESRSVSYNEAFGGVVDLVAARMMWKGCIPAFVIAVMPRVEVAGYTYRKIIQVDLNQGAYKALKTEPGSFPPSGENISRQLARLAEDGSIHPDDQKRFVSFVRLEHLQDVLGTNSTAQTCIYRRRVGNLFRWNLIEIMPGFGYTTGSLKALICVRDVHDVLREGLEREEINIRNREIIYSLGEQSFSIYTVDLNTGAAKAVRENDAMQDGLSSEILLWDTVCSRIKKELHSAYQEEFLERFSLDGLRRSKKLGLQKEEFLCQQKNGDDYRYIAATATLGREHEQTSYAVLAFRDVDQRMRQELAHSQRDMQMAAILKSRFSIMNTVNLETGQCERVILSKPTKPQNTLIDDYDSHVQCALSYIHPEDAEKYRSLLSLEHLRQKGAATEDYQEEVCQYRLKGDPVRWIEQHVIYTRQENGVMVNILGQDITREKNRQAAEHQALEDRSYIISSLSSLFFSTYYVDLEHDTFRAVTQLSKVGDILGTEVDCVAALRIYAENFVHSEDREEYLRIMNPENWRRTLRWWHPYTALEYRTPPDDETQECGWIRATAVVAQIGEDDIPKTVVYWAQDITETKKNTNNI